MTDTTVIERFSQSIPVVLAYLHLNIPPHL